MLITPFALKAQIITTFAGRDTLAACCGYGNGGPATNANFIDPAGLAIDNSGNIYIADYNGFSVRKINTSGIVSTVAGNYHYSGYTAGSPATATSVGSAYGIAVDRGGNLYICSDDYIVYKVNTSGIITTFAGNGTLGYTGDGGQATVAQLFGVLGLLSDSSGNIYIADAGNAVIRKVNLAGIITTIAGTGYPGYSGDGGPATAAQLNLPIGMALDNAGNLYIADSRNFVVRKINTSGIISTVAGSGVQGYSGDGGSATLAEINDPTGIAIDQIGNLYVSDNNENVIRKIEASGIITTYAGNGYDPVPGNGGYSGDGGPATAAELGRPLGLLVDGSNSLYIADYYNHVVRNICSPDAGTITFGGLNAICIGNQIELQNSSPGGIWSVSNGNTIITGDTLTGISLGVDSIFYTVSNACGIAVALMTVGISPKVPPITGNLAVCLGDTSIATDSLPGGTWLGGLPVVHLSPNMQDSGIVVGISAGITVITYQVDSGCYATAIITVNPAPNPGTITGPDTICKNASFILNDTIPGGLWSISPQEIATIGSATGAVNSLIAGNATITYNIPPNIFGCSNAAKYQLTVLSAAVFVIDNNVGPIKCYGGTGSISVSIFNGSGNYNYLWSNGNTGTFLTGIGPGVYTLLVNDIVSQCADSASYTLSQPDSMHSVFDATKDLCNANNGSITLATNGGTPPYQYKWSNNATTSEISGLNAGLYQLSITDVNGCLEQLSILVADSTCPAIVIHNGISPNDDGINDTWIIEGLQPFADNTVQVFDKWGNIVYQQTNYKNDWAGGKLPDGTYYYLVKLNSKNAPDGKDSYTGTLLIKR